MRASGAWAALAPLDETAPRTSRAVGFDVSFDLVMPTPSGLETSAANGVKAAYPRAGAVWRSARLRRLVWMGAQLHGDVAAAAPVAHPATSLRARDRPNAWTTPFRGPPRSRTLRKCLFSCGPWSESRYGISRSLSPIVSGVGSSAHSSRHFSARPSGYALPRSWHLGCQSAWARGRTVGDAGRTGRSRDFILVRGTAGELSPQRGQPAPQTRMSRPNPRNVIEKRRDPRIDSGT